MLNLRKLRSFPLVLSMVMLILPLAGCIEERINLKVQKKLPSIIEDGRVYWEIRESVDVFVPPGKFIWSGNVTNFSGPLPDRFDFLIEHRAKGGKVLQSWTLEAPLNPDGKIPKMSVDFPGAVLKAKERLRFNMSPRGQNFSGGDATINFLYRF